MKKRLPDENCAGICGLFCGTCAMYSEQCHGCLSDFLWGHCTECVHGFRTCAKEHNVTWCWECDAFPCERVKDFSKKHIENGICHHEHVIDDGLRMREIGAKAWVAEQTAAHTCPKCGELVNWNQVNLHRCEE